MYVTGSKQSPMFRLWRYSALICHTNCFSWVISPLVVWPASILPFQSCCSPACCWSLAHHVLMCPNSSIKGRAELQEPLGRTEAICAGTNVKGDIVGPLFSLVLCSSVHFYSFEENIPQNPRLEIAEDIQYQLLTYALWRSTWMLSSAYPLNSVFLPWLWASGMKFRIMPVFLSLEILCRNYQIILVLFKYI